MPLEELHLGKAPIAEALISLHIAPLLNERLPAFQAAAIEIREEYPYSESLAQLEFGFQVTVGSGVQTSHRDEPLGLRLTSRDKRQIAVFKRDGFVFSRLPPYERWDSFRSEARRLWDIYRGRVGPVKVLRFGLRYINKLHIPFGQEVDKYLNLCPQIPNNPDGTPMVMNSSYLRVDTILKEPAGQLIIQQASLPPEKEGYASLSLDFDLQFANQQTDDQHVWLILEAARRVKNQLFVDSLKPTYLETFRR